MKSLETGDHGQQCQVQQAQTRA